MLVGKDHAHWLVAIAKLDYKLVIRGSFISSVLINIGHGWQYQAVKDLKLNYLNLNVLYANYFRINGYSYSDYPRANQGNAYFVYSIVYFVINFCFFFIVNTGIEVKLVRRMHTELQEKRQRLAKMNDHSLSVPVVATATSQLAKACQSDEEKKREKEDVKKERKVIKMVIINGFFNFVLRAPDILFWMENQSVWSALDENYGDVEKTVEQYVPGLLTLIADIGFLTYILTFSTNFFIFYKYKKNFRQAFVLFWKSSKSSALSK
jgi:hypothetical protein